MPDELAASRNTGEAVGISRVFLTLMFLVGGIWTTAVGYRATHGGLSSALAPMLPWWQYGLLAVFAIFAVYALLRRKMSRVFWEVFFTTTLFLGVWFALLLVLPLWAALLGASVFTLMALLLRSVLLHDIFYLVGAVGVALDLAGWLPAEALVVVLVVVTIYDMVAGPPGGPVERLATEMVQRGIVPGVVIPTRWSQLTTDLDTVLRQPSALLGAGDLILPLCLVAKASFVGFGAGLIVVGGLVLGAAMLGRSHDLHPRAALPALTVGASLPFIVLRLIGWI